MLHSVGTTFAGSNGDTFVSSGSDEKSGDACIELDPAAVLSNTLKIVVGPVFDSLVELFEKSTDEAGGEDSRSDAEEGDAVEEETRGQTGPSEGAAGVS